MYNVYSSSQTGIRQVSPAWTTRSQSVPSSVNPDWHWLGNSQKRSASLFALWVLLGLLVGVPMATSLAGTPLKPKAGMVAVSIGENARIPKASTTKAIGTSAAQLGLQRQRESASVSKSPNRQPANFGTQKAVGGAGQSAARVAAAGIDSDGDGVDDDVDLDDDNDGILDVEECQPAYKVYTYNRVDASFVTNAPYTITGQTSQSGLVSQTTAGTDLTYNGFNWKLIASNVIPDASNQIAVSLTPTASTSGTFLIVDAVLVTNGKNFYVIDNSSSSGFTRTGTWNVASLANTYLGSEANSTTPHTGKTAVWTFTDLQPLTPAGCDLDSDGIVNSLDLDSDNDGCPDALEGGAAFTMANITLAGALTGAVSSASATLGVPVIAGAGQTVGASQNSAINDCLDSDGDGIANVYDLDDDNDGILDTDEGCAPSIVTLEDNGTFGTIATGSRNVTYTVTGYSYQATNSGAAGYAVISNQGAEAWFPAATGSTTHFAFLRGHTTGATNDAFLAVNGSTALGIFYQSSFTITAGGNYDVGFWGVNAAPLNDPAGLPNLGVRIKNSSSVIVASTTSGDLPPVGAPNWTNIQTSVNLAAGTYTIEIYNISTDSGGNDFAIDDIFVRPQSLVAFCTDTDGDGIANSLDLDSDGDGCFDAIEGGASFTNANVTPAGVLTGAVSSATATLGIPVTAAAGQTIGTSQSATVQDANCPVLPTIVITTPLNTTVSSPTVPISGTATPFASVTVSGPNGQTCTTTANASGAWTCSSLTFTPGAQTVTAIASNTAGVSTPATGSFTVVASLCPNPTVGGTAAYAGGTVCDVSNAGTITLTGQTGTVVKWQTSTNGGANWTDIVGTFGKNLYNFVNAANGQQFRAVLNNGGACVDAVSNPATISTSPTACSSATCDKSNGDVAFTVTPAIVGSNYSHVIIMTNGSGVIQYVSAPGSSTVTNVAVGNYLTYLVSYDNTQLPLPTLTVGTSLSAIGGACAVFSSQLPIKVCPSVVFDCANISVAGSFIAGTPSSGTMTVPITGAQAGPFSLTLTGTGFASVPSPFVTTLTASQTAISIPFTYDGSGVASVRSLSLSSSQANNSCTPTVNVLPVTPCIALTPGQVIPGKASVLTGGATSFSYVGATAGSSVRWYVAPSITASPSSGTGTVTPAITFLNAGYYQIIFEETNSSIPVGCNVPNTVQSTLDYLVNAPVNPCASPGSSTVVTSPSTAAIVVGGTGSFTLLGGQPYNNVQWQIIPATGASPNTGSGAITSAITFSQEGLYRIVYTMTNAGDLTCTPVQKVSSGLISVGLNPCAAPSPISVINAAGLSTATVGTTTTFNAIGGVPGLMTWKVYPTTGVSSVSGTGSSATLTFTQPGNYIVTFISSNSTLPLGCTKPVATAGSTNIIISASPNVVPVPINVDPGKSTTVCMPITDADAVDSFTASICSPPGVGTATVVASNNPRQVCVTYTAPATGPASTSVCIQVCDSYGNCKQSIIPIIVNPPSQTAVTPEPPVVIVVPIVTPKDTPATVCMPIKDPNVGDTHSVSVCANPSKGTATATVNNTTHEVCVTYTPTSGSVGQDQICLVVCDQTGLCKQVIVPITIVDPTPPGVTPVSPKVTPVPIVTPIDTPVIVCTPIVDNTGDTHTATICGQPSSGTALVGVDNTTHTLCVTYTAGSTPTNTSLCVQVCDQGGLCTDVIIPISVLPTSKPPVLTPDIANTNINTPVSGKVLTNDTDPQGGPLTASLISQPANGTVVFNSDGSYTYTPPTGFTGTTSFCYSATNTAGLSASTCVTINVNPTPDPSPTGNDRPIPNNDATQTTIGVPVTINIVANDTDPNSASTLNGQLNTPTLVSQPSVGTAVLNGNGTVTYTPPAGFTGVVTFPYQICDKATTPLCATALVTVTILPTPPANTTLAPVAIDDAVITRKDTPATGTVATNDSDPQGLPLTYTSGQPTSGTVVMSPNGSYTYTPAPGYVGPASFTYAVCNSAGKCDVATVSVLVQSPNGLILLPKAWLQGALFGVTAANGIMRDDLRSKGYLPLVTPYIGFNALTPTPVLSSSAVFATTGNDAIVDWVFVELRSPSSSSVIVDSRSALIQRDGDIVELDGVSPMVFSKATPGNYYVSVKHRNHLGTMTSTAIPLSATGTVVDFRIPDPTLYYRATTSAINQAQVTVAQGVALWAGNVLYDKTVIYQSTNNDVAAISVQVKTARKPDGTLYNVTGAANYTLKGYYTGDVNMDGNTIYQGTGNDVNYIFLNVTKNHKGNVTGSNIFIIREQLP